MHALAVGRVLSWKEDIAMIEFRFRPEKFASAVAYMAKSRPGLTKKQICKLMYFADKEHLLRYGRTITGDVYHALPQGHVPSKGLNAINGRVDRVGAEAVDQVKRYGHLEGWKFILEKDPDMRVFSKSDIVVLDDVISRLGHLSAFKLERASHNEPSWKKTDPNGRVSFELFFEGHPEAELMKETLSEEHSVSRAA
jgi:uncharacterized phage-associated protein